MSESIGESGGTNTAAQVSAPERSGAGDMAVDATSTAERTEFISFAIGDEHYGVDIMAVREIREWTDVTHLPKQPDYVRGVLNLRGVIVPIIDLRCRFGQGLTETTPLHIMIVVQIEDRQIGLLADRVLDIVSLEAGRMQPVPKVADDGVASFLAGLITTDSEMIALIDLSRLLAAPVEELSGQ
jgi:purine-binding chemotaxis protein CheW